MRGGEEICEGARRGVHMREREKSAVVSEGGGVRVLNNARHSRLTTAALATIQVRSYSKWSYRREFGVSEVR